MGVGLEHLNALYADNADPWNFAESNYEQDKFTATRAALSRPRYKGAFELGCGNGQLARHLAPLCDTYTGMDAVEVAVETARRTLPQACFLQGFYPCALPKYAFDLLILSEILYFLDPSALKTLARDIATFWSRAEVICVTYLGQTSHGLQGQEALQIFTAALDTHAFEAVTRTEGYRIDRGVPEDAS